MKPQLQTYYVGHSGHRMFVSQNVGICLSLSVIFPLFLQTIKLSQTLVLTPTLNKLSTQQHH